MLKSIARKALNTAFAKSGFATAAKHYDLVTVGGGSGGLFCALKAKTYGKNVCVIDRHKLGGRCVHAGCIPKKIIYHATMIKEDMSHGPEYGVTFNNPKIDWLKIKQVRDDYTHQMHLGYLKNCQNAGVEFMHANAKFAGPHELLVTDPTTGEASKVTADHIVISTGSRPLMPKCIVGVSNCLNTDSFFNLTSVPKNIFVIGGGYIGVEIACSLQAFGIKTTLCMLEDNLVTPFDVEITTCLKEYMESVGITILPRASVNSVAQLASGSCEVNCKGYDSVKVDAVLCAAGIKANTEGIGLEEIGVKLNSNGTVVVDDFENTSIKGIYALGDATGKVILTPVAKTAGSRLATRLFGGDANSKLDYSVIPSVAFSHPPMGKVGLTEAEAKAKFGESNIKVYKSKFTNLFYDVTSHKQPSLFKLICRLPDEKIIGVHAIGRGVDEMMQGYSVALTAGATKKDYDNTLAIHPTASENFVDMEGPGHH